MFLLPFFIIVVFLLLLYVNCNKNNTNSEYFSSYADKPAYSDISRNLPPSLEQLERDRIKNNNDFNLFNTLTFNDVVIYENEPDGRLGIDRCLDNKVGTCVPYGNMTGIAYYYPPMYSNQNFGDIITAELTPQELKTPYFGNITYPNLR